MKPTKEIARKVVELVSHGLVRGVGVQEPGKMCVEAVVNAAFGNPHGDDPPCVSKAVRAFKIALNDSDWSSDSARAFGLRRLAVAQLGSDQIDEVIFVKELALATVRKILPIALRAAKLESEAVACENASDISAAEAAARAAAVAGARAAVARAAEAAVWAAAAEDGVLSMMAECAVQALIKCESPGCQWLDLCE